MDNRLGLMYLVAIVTFAHVKGLALKDTYIRQAENSQNKKRFVFSSNMNTNININNNNFNVNNNNNNNMNTNININYNSAIMTQVTMVQSSGPLCTLPNGVQLVFGQTAIGADGCTKMTCSATGTVSSSRSCNHHQPSQYGSHRCSYGGQVYHVGDTFNHTDGCNKCVCGTSSIQCTNVRACKQKADCTYHGVGYSLGQSFSHLDGCNICQCTIMGVMCTNNQCTTTTTTTAAPFACEWYGRFYHNGDTMPGDGCHTCTCYQGQTLCSASLNCPVSG